MLIVFSIRTLILPGYITLDRYFSQIIAAFGDFAILARDKFKLFTKNLNLNHYITHASAYNRPDLFC